MIAVVVERDAMGSGWHGRRDQGGRDHLCGLRPSVDGRSPAGVVVLDAGTICVDSGVVKADIVGLVVVLASVAKTPVEMLDMPFALDDCKAVVEELDT